MYRVNRYEGKDHSDSESTSRPHGVEVKLRPCIHEIYLILFVHTLFCFVNILVLKPTYNSVMYKGGKWTKWAFNAIFNGKCVLKTK